MFVGQSFFFHNYDHWNLGVDLYCGHHKNLMCRQVSLFQRLICTLKYTIGTSETVLIREVSFKRVSHTPVLPFSRSRDTPETRIPPPPLPLGHMIQTPPTLDPSMGGAASMWGGPPTTPYYPGAATPTMQYPMFQGPPLPQGVLWEYEDDGEEGRQARVYMCVPTMYLPGLVITIGVQESS